MAHPEKEHRRAPYVMIGIAVAVVLLAVVGVLGGFRAQPSGPDTAKPGTVVHQGLFDVQVTDARAGQMKLNSFDPLRNLLLVRMRVTNLGDQSYGLSTFMDGIAAEPKPGKYVSAAVMDSQGLFDVQVTDARAGRMKLSSFDPLRNLLLVRMRVTNLGDQSYGLSTFMDGIVAEPKPGKYVSAAVMDSQGYIGGQETSTIHPHLPITVQLVWPIGDARPENVTLALREWTYAQGFTSDEYYWSSGKSAGVQAKVTLPVREGATS